MTTNEPNQKRHKLFWIQFLRGVAALIVVLGHSYLEWNKFAVNRGFEHFRSSFSWGFGVDIFFVISGFVMWTTSKDVLPGIQSSLEFLKRRIIRIVPMYWLTTFALAATIIVAPGLLGSIELNLKILLTSLFFLPMPRATGVVAPLLPVGWTLEYEFFFYVTFALALILNPKTRFWALVGFFALLAGVGAAVSIPNQTLAYWMNPIILEFIYGVAIAACLDKIRSLPVWVVVPFFLISLVLATFALFGQVPHGPRFLTFGIPAALIVAASLTLAEPGQNIFSKTALWAGNISYSWYLSHMFAVRAVRAVWRYDAELLFFVACIVVTGATASALYFFVERPGTNYLNRITKARRPVVAKSGAPGDVAVGDTNVGS
jgi:exopolysaccharide production protein ExoZ